MSIKEINKNISVFQSMINKHNELSGLRNFIVTVTEFVTTPTTRLLDVVYVEFYRTLNIIAYNLNSNLLRQVDFKTRKDLSIKQHDYIKMALHSMTILKTVFEYAASLEIMARNAPLFGKMEGNRVCGASDVYIESMVLDKLQDFCEKIPGGNPKRTVCELMATLRQHKQQLATEPDPSIELLENYCLVWDQFQNQFVRLMFTNFIAFHAAGIVPCLAKFLDQQIQLKIEFLERRDELRTQKLNNQPIAIVW